MIFRALFPKGALVLYVTSRRLMTENLTGGREGEKWGKKKSF